MTVSDQEAFEARHYAEFAAAFCRGKLGLDRDCRACEAVRRGLDAGLRLHKFKRNAELPRVRRVLGMLRGICPSSVLDVGSGRGTFLWPLLEEFPRLPVTTLELRADRASDFRAVAQGGVVQLSTLEGNVTTHPLAAGSFDVVTALEVLEHINEVELAAAKLVIAARRCVIASVPSTSDHNPEHVRLFNVETLKRLFTNAGASHVAIEHVLGHRIALARVRP